MIKLIILDVDGVLTDGTKIYDKKHNVIGKRFLCKDFTAIKRFVAAGIDVVMISGDNWNFDMASKRNIEFICSRGEDLSLDKSRYLERISQKHGVDLENMAFVGDDYFDLSMFHSLKYTFCPSDAPHIIKQNSYHVLNSQGGSGVVVELYDYAITNNFFEEASMEKVADLDIKEISSKEMS